MPPKKINLDLWQKDVLASNSKRILICKGRQIGGTTILARKAADRIAKNPNEEIMVVSITEDQAQLVIIMVLSFLETYYKQLISKKKQDTTKSKILLKNGSQIISRPVGQTGSSVRGFTKGVLWLNEGSRLPEFVFEAAKPMLLTTDGDIWMDSTPFGKKGYFYECFQNKNDLWTVFYKTSVEVMTERPISPSWTKQQRDGALKLLEDERKEMSELQFGQEYLGLFLEDLRQFFEADLIKECQRLQRPKEINTKAKNYLGCDIARMGDDEGTYEIVSEENSHFYHRESVITKKQLTTETEKKILEIAELWKARKVGIDAGAGTLGVSVLDHLLTTKIKHKVVAMNNRALSMDDDDSKKQRLLKEDLYFNLKSMMEHGEISLLDDAEVRLSLSSIQYEFINTSSGTKRFRIFGNYSHVAEGLIRAAYLAKKEKSLNLWAY